MATIAELQVQIGADISRLEKGISRAQRKLQNAGRSMQRVGRSLTTGLTLPLAAVGAGAIKAASDFESSFTDIRKTVEASESQFAALSGEMRAMSKEMPTSVNELNRLGGVAGQLGVEAENIADFTKTIAMLGDTTDVAGEQAALSLSRFMNVMGTAQSDIDRLGATIVGLGNNFAAMESEIIEIGNSLAPLGNAIGFSEQQVLAFATTIAASGGKAQAASTAFQKMGNTMKQAVLQGTDDLQVFAKTAGMTASQFQQAFQKDSAGALLSFMKGLRRVQQEGESTAAILDKVGLADQRLIRELGKVIGNLDQLTQAQGMANDAWQRNTALTREAQKRYSTFSSRLKILWNRVKDVGITIGNIMIPTINRLIDISKDLISSFSNLSDETKRMGVVIAGIFGASGPILVAIGTLTAALGAISWPIVLGVAAIGGAIAAIVANWDTLVAYFTSGAGAKVWNTIKQAAIDVWGSLKRLFSSVGDLTESFSKNWGDDVVGVIQLSVSTISEAVTTIIDTLGLVINLIRGDWSAAWRDFKNVATVNIRDLDKEMFLAMSSMAQSAAAMTNLLTGDFKTAFEQFKFAYGFDNEYSRFREEQKKNTQVIENQGQKALWSANALRAYANAVKSTPKPTAPATPNSTGAQGGNGAAQSLARAEKPIQKVTQSAKDLSVTFSAVQRDFSRDASEFAIDAEKGMSLVEAAMGKAKKTSLEFGQALQTAVSNAVTSFAQTIGNVFTGDAGASSFFNSILLIAADFASQLGKIMIAIGTASLALQSAFANPFAAIAAGAALVALSQVAKNLIKKGPQGPPELAQGGLAFGPTLAVVGDNKNARSNPEVIAPLDKLKGMMGQGGGNVTRVEGIIRGSDIHLANERGKNKFR